MRNSDPFSTRHLLTLLMSMLAFVQIIITPVFARLLEVGITIYILGAYLILLAFKSGAEKLVG